jgi:hypothetical protein
MIPVNRPMPRRPAATYVLPKKQKRVTKGRLIFVAVAVLLVGLGIAWAAGLFGSDPRIAEIKDLQAKMADPSLSEKDRRAVMGEMFQKMGTLPEDMRSKLFQSGPPRLNMEGPIKHISELLALPPDKQVAEIDKEIDRAVKMSKGQGGPPGAGGQGRGGQGPGGPGPGGPGQSPNAGLNRLRSSMPADARAQFNIWRQLVQARANQRGITMPK